MRCASIGTMGIAPASIRSIICAGFALAPNVKPKRRGVTALEQTEADFDLGLHGHRRVRPSCRAGSATSSRLQSPFDLDLNPAVALL